MLKALVVDDEQVSIDLIKFYCTKSQEIDVIMTLKNGLDAKKFLANYTVDVLFLDINIPGMDGMELLKSMLHPPMVVLFTSDPNHGIEAFEYNVTDYLVKPVEYPRFQKAVSKLLDEQRLRRDLIYDKKSIYVRSNNKSIRLSVDDILYVEALADYVVFNTSDKKFIVHSTMKALEGKLPIEVFARVHRSYFVNMSKIESIEDGNIVIQKNLIPISASYKDLLNKKLNFI
jgi:DNA-binding LytR/AlgR family response regulator